jgi:hypothetical protein
MSVIKPRTRGKQDVRIHVRLEREAHETLHAHAAFLGESPEYVLNEVIDTVLARDRDYLAWRADHPGSHVPDATAARPPARRHHEAVRQLGAGVGSGSATMRVHEESG